MFDDEMYSVWIGFNTRIGIYPQSDSTLYYPNVRKSQKAAQNFANKAAEELMQNYGYNYVIKKDLLVSAMDNVRYYDIVATKMPVNPNNFMDSENIHLVVACGLDFDLKEYVRRSYNMNL